MHPLLSILLLVVHRYTRTWYQFLTRPEAQALTYRSPKIIGGGIRVCMQNTWYINLGKGAYIFFIGAGSSNFTGTGKSSRSWILTTGASIHSDDLLDGTF